MPSRYQEAPWPNPAHSLPVESQIGLYAGKNWLGDTGNLRRVLHVKCDEPATLAARARKGISGFGLQRFRDFWQSGSERSAAGGLISRFDRNCHLHHHSRWIFALRWRGGDIPKAPDKAPNRS